jgi:ribosomal-protein-alanine N-acetyltransferase
MNVEELIKNLPTLKTERLILRKLRRNDAEDMFEYAQDAEIAFMGLWQPFRTLEDSIADIEQVLEGYARGDLMTWAIEHKDEQKMIGRCNLYNYSPEDARADIGYAMNRAYWGQGYATEAVERLITFGFEALALNRIGAICLPQNHASLRVLKKVGMIHEGKRREYAFLNGAYHDLELYSLLRKDWT